MPGRPNILVFCTDQQRADHMSCAGHPVLRTPNIDRIAERGVRFANAYTTYTACMPARGTLLTGLSHRAAGMRSNGVALPRDIPTLPRLLGAAGYRTHAVGKLHLMPWSSPRSFDVTQVEGPLDNPERRIHWERGAIRSSPGDYYGFQTVRSTIGHVVNVWGDYRTWLDTRHPGAAAGYDRPEGAAAWDLSIDPELHYNHWIGDEAIEFIRSTPKERPFFLWCSFPDPHAPFAAVKKWAEAYRDREIPLPRCGDEIDAGALPETLLKVRGGAEAVRERARYASGERLREFLVQTFAMISHVDEQVGRVLDALSETGRDGDTVIVFVSDHGDELGEHGFLHKGYWPWDGNARVPLIISFPGCDGAGRVVDDVVSLIDLVPTLLDLAGVPPADPLVGEAFAREVGILPSPLPGESLVPVIVEGRAPQRGCALFETDDERVKAFDLLQMRVLVTNEYKLCHYSPTGELVLYDRRSDPGEERNLARDPAYAMVVTELLSRMVVEINRSEARLPRRFVDA